MGLSDGFDIGYERKRKAENDSMISGLQLEEWSCHFLRWEGCRQDRFRGNEQGFSFKQIKFELPLRHPGNHVREAVWYKSGIWESCLEWRFLFGYHRHYAKPHEWMKSAKK